MTKESDQAEMSKILKEQLNLSGYEVKRYFGKIAKESRHRWKSTDSQDTTA